MKIIEKANKHSFAPRPLIFKLEQGVLKFNDNFIDNWHCGNFDELRKSFWECQFLSSVVTFK